MTQEDKDLLLKYLCMALPYGVKVFVSGNDFDNYQYPYLLTAISKFGHDSICKVYSPVYTPFGSPNIENVKPYLRSMSSMTFGEWEEMTALIYQHGRVNRNPDNKNELLLWLSAEGNDMPIILMDNVFSWLNAHHFDFMGLIPKGLAVEVTENNNPYK